MRSEVSARASSVVRGSLETRSTPGVPDRQPRAPREPYHAASAWRGPCRLVAEGTTTTRHCRTKPLVADVRERRWTVRAPTRRTTGSRTGRRFSPRRSPPRTSARRRRRRGARERDGGERWKAGSSRPRAPTQSTSAAPPRPGIARRPSASASPSAVRSGSAPRRGRRRGRPERLSTAPSPRTARRVPDAPPPAFARPPPRAAAPRRREVNEVDAGEREPNARLRRGRRRRRAVRASSPSRGVEVDAREGLESVARAGASRPPRATARDGRARAGDTVAGSARVESDVRVHRGVPQCHHPRMPLPAHERGEHVERDVRLAGHLDHGGHVSRALRDERTVSVRPTGSASPKYRAGRKA